MIPVDRWSAAIIAVAGEARLAPAAGIPRPRRLPVASGVRNPFRYGRLGRAGPGWFTENPLYDSHGQPIVVHGAGPSPDGDGFIVNRPGPVGRLELAEKVAGYLPHSRPPGRVDGGPRGTTPAGRRGPRLRGALRGVHRDRGPYRVDRLMALWGRTTPTTASPASTPPRWTGPPTSVTSISLRSSTMPGCAHTRASQPTGWS